jgi:hypothetical protein
MSVALFRGNVRLVSANLATRENATRSVASFFRFGASGAMSGAAQAVSGAECPLRSPTLSLACALASIASGPGFSESSGSGTASLLD